MRNRKAGLLAEATIFSNTFEANISKEFKVRVA
jgi:hypothetical protein